MKIARDIEIHYHASIDMVETNKNDISEVNFELILKMPILEHNLRKTWLKYQLKLSKKSRFDNL